MAVVNNVFKLFDDVFSEGVANVTKNVAEEIATQAPTKSRTIAEQTSTLVNDMSTKWKATLNDSQLAEATHNIVKRARNNPDLDLNEEVFTHASIYSHANNANLADVLYNLEGSVTAALGRENDAIARAAKQGGSATPKYTLPDYTKLTQDDINLMFTKNQAMIESATRNPNYASEMNKSFMNKLYEGPAKDMQVDAAVFKYTGRTLTGDELTDANLVNTAINNKTKEAKAQAKRNRQIKKRDAYVDRFAEKVNDPSVPVKDIMRWYTGIQDLGQYTRKEAQDMADEIDYLLTNRQHINKPFQTEDWNRLTKLRADLDNQFQKGEFAATPKEIAKANARADDKLIRKATGQNTYQMQGFTTPRSANYSGAIDDAEVGFPGLKFREDQKSLVMEYGVDAVPSLKKNFWAMMDAKNLPDNIKIAFLGGNKTSIELTEHNKNFVDMLGGDKEIQDDFMDFINNLNTRDARFVSNKGQEVSMAENYFLQSNMKVRMLQMYGELNESALEAAAHGADKLAVRTAVSSSLLRNPQIVHKTGSLSSATNDYLMNLMYGSFGNADLIGVSKILRVYPEYFNRMLDKNALDALQALDRFAKELGVKDAWKELGARAANNKEMAALYSDIHEALSIYVERLRGRYMMAKSLDISDEQLMRTSTEVEGKEFQTFRPSSQGKSYEEIQKGDIDDGIGVTDESRAVGAWYESGIYKESEIRSALDDVDLMEKTKKLGGQPGLDDFYQYDKLSQNSSSKVSQYIKNTLKFVDTDNFGPKDLQELDYIFNGFKDATGKRYESNYALQNRLAAYVDSLSDQPDRVYGYLMDLREYAKSISNKLSNRVEAGDEAARVLYNSMRQFENTIDGHLQRVSTENFKKSLEANTEAMRKQGNIVESTSLDSMLGKGQYEMPVRRIVGGPTNAKPPKTPSERSKVVNKWREASNKADYYAYEKAQAMKDARLIAEGKMPSNKSLNATNIDHLVKRWDGELQKAINERDALRAQMEGFDRYDLLEGLRLDHIMIKPNITNDAASNFIQATRNAIITARQSGNEALFKKVIWEQIHRIERQLQRGVMDSTKQGQTPRMRLQPEYQTDKNLFGLDLHVSDSASRQMLEDEVFLLRKVVQPEIPISSLASQRAKKINEFLGIGDFVSASDKARKVEPAMTQKQKPTTSNKDKQWKDLEASIAKRERAEKEQGFIDAYTAKQPEPEADSWLSDLPF